MTRVVVSLIVLAVLAVGAYVFFMHTSAPVVVPSAATSTAPYTVPALSKPYENTGYGFSLKMPADFTSAETTDPGGNDVITLQDQSGNGIQITVSPFDEDTGQGYTLTKERILKDVPDLTIRDEQPLPVGEHYQGIAFKSDNPAFGGDSRDVWFVFRGNLYQISTYARLDDLLKAMFATWQFK